MASKKLTILLDLDDASYRGKLSFDIKELARLNTALGRTDRATKQASSATRGFGTRLRDTVIVIGLARHALENLNHVVLSLPRAIVNSNAELERMEMLLRGLSVDSKSFGDAQRQAASDMAYLFNMAKTSPFDVKTLTDSLVKLKSTGLDFAVEGVESLAGTSGSARFMLEALTNSVAAFGGTSEIFHRASIAVQQMAGKGVISMEELRQQLGEAVPNATRLMARGLGVSMRQLVDTIATGRLEATVGLKALALQMKLFNDGAAAEAAATFIGLKNQIKTQMTLAAAEVDKSGLNDAIKKQMIGFREFLKTDEFKKLAQSFGEAMKMIVDSLPKAIQLMQSLWDATAPLREVAVLAAQGYMNILDAIKSLGITSKQFAATLGALTAGFLAYRTAVLAATLASINYNRVMTVGVLALVNYRKAVSALTMALGSNGLIGAVMAIASSTSKGSSAALIMAGVLTKLRGVIVGAATALMSGAGLLAAIRSLGLLIVRFIPHLAILSGVLTAAYWAYKKIAGATEEARMSQEEYDRQVASGIVSEKLIQEQMARKADALDEMKGKAEDAIEAQKNLNEEMAKLKRPQSDDSRAMRERAVEQAKATVAAAHKALQEANAKYQEADQKEGKLLKMLGLTFSDADRDMMAIEVTRAMKGARVAAAAEQDQSIKEFNDKKISYEENVKNIADINNRLIGQYVGAWQIQRKLAEDTIKENSDLTNKDQVIAANSARAKIQFIDETIAKIQELRAMAANGQPLMSELLGDAEKAGEYNKYLSQIEGKIAKITATTGKLVSEEERMAILLKDNKDLTKDEIKYILQRAAHYDDLNREKRVSLELDKFQNKLNQVLIQDASRLASATNENPWLKAVGQAEKMKGQILANIEKLKESRDLYQGNAEQLARYTAELEKNEAALAGIDNTTAEVALTNLRKNLTDMQRERMTDREIRLAETKTALSQLAIMEGSFTEEQRKIAQSGIDDMRDALAQRQQISESAFLTSLDKFREASVSMEDVWSSTFTGMADALTEFAISGESSFSSLADSIGKMIIKMTMQMMIYRALMGMFGQPVASPEIPQASMGADFFTGQTPQASAAPRPFPFALGGIMTSFGPAQLKQYASGGIANSPQVAVFGEGSRPEAYVPLPDGRTIPVTMEGSSSNVQVNIINNSGTQMDAQETGRRMDGGSMIIDVVMQEMSRPGRFRDSIKGAARS